MATKKSQPKKPAKRAKLTAKQRKNSEARARSLANLKPFQKGVSGNPAGRPKSVTLSEAYRQQLAAQQTEGADASTYAEVIAKMVCEGAAKGNVNAARELADRTEGKPKQALDVDLRVFDWRELARANGLNEQDVLLEARRLIESAALTSGA